MASSAASTVTAYLPEGTAPRATPEAVAALARRSAWFSLFSLPNAASPSTGVPLTPFTSPLFIAFQVSEALHRFEVQELPPSAECGLRLRQAYGADDVARVEMQMTPMPNNFQAGAGRTPWSTVLLPVLSQRFAPLAGHFQFLDFENSGFGAVGAGRVMPTTGGNAPRLAAVLEVEEPTGRLAGLGGMGVVSGDIEPPAGFAFNVLFRIDDPEGHLTATQPPPPLVDAADPTPSTAEGPGTAFLPFLAEPDPTRPMTITRVNGRYLSVRFSEQLRLVDLAFSVGPQLGSRTRLGPVVGRHEATWMLDLENAGRVIPAWSESEEFSFFDASGQSIGGLRADTVEGRVVPGAVTQVAGFAVPREGTGQFRDPIGTISINGAWNPRTGAISTCYMVRLTAADAVWKVLAPGPIQEFSTCQYATKRSSA